jgi:uncharacterized protein (TIGR02145 family)
MKSIFITGRCIFVILLLFLFHSCKKEVIPTISTSTVANITATTASSGGVITSDGGAEITARGVCWSTSEYPSTTDSKTVDNGGTGQFVSNISGLTAGSSYHVRAYATNSAGTAYGADLSFTTLGQAPEAITQAASDILPTGATLNGTVNANYLTTTVTFEYGTTSNYGQSAAAAQNPVAGSSITAVSSAITGLTEGTVYHFRIKTVNSLGTTYGSDMTFTTLGQKPTAMTLAACCIRNNGATLNGSVTANYVSTTVTFEYGITTAYGSSIAASPGTITGNNSTSVRAILSGLNSGTTYHFRIKAVNSLGTTYGNDMSFPTLSTVTDVDGNTYNYVVIGSQAWMKENLKVTRYRNGDLIGTTIPATLDVSSETAPKYQWAYDGNESNVAVYGRLYTWHAITDSRNLCPVGWHIPSDIEWTTLSTYLGGINVAGGKMKETGTMHWISPNLGATNESGFTALPGGYRSDNGSYTSIGLDGHWWSSTDTWYRYIWSNSITINSDHSYMPFGFSVRCVKDN